MVIAALAFVGIIVGALLTAVGYSYRLKLQDLNSRDNFYYVEQAMNEIYAGVGSEVVGDMQDAYVTTVENMVYYDLDIKAYVSKDKEQVQQEFEEKFMKNVQTNDLFQYDKLGDTLESYISNKSVKLDRSKLLLDVEYTGGEISKITIKNITLTRTQNYDKNVASGSYTQTISTDIEIGEPDFDVLFNSTTDEYANIFKYSMVADMGIEIEQPTTSLTIAGNIYAASDYYNKKYNESTYLRDGDGEPTVSDSEKKFSTGITYAVNKKGEDGTISTENESIDVYTHGSVTSKEYYGPTNNTYYNQYSSLITPTVSGSNEYYDGVYERSMYSGLYINGSKVNIMADMVIVPGSVAVMNEGQLSMYAKSDGNAKAELWTDDIILGGISGKNVTSSSAKDVVTYSGSSALLKANVYVKDDSELNASGSKLAINGDYYGYGDSTERDERKFIPTVNSENFQVTYSDGETNVTENRGHYNSSAIIVNGQQSTLDLSLANVVYVAGRSYIELSKDVVDVASGTDANGTVTQKYTFEPTAPNFVTDDTTDTVFVRDYKLGESISFKTNQKAYIPILFTGMPQPVKNSDGEFQGYYEASLHEGLRDSSLFDKYFPESVFEDYKIPCVMCEISGKRYYYYDFATAYKMMYDADSSITSKYASAQYYASAFIIDYVAELKKPDDESFIKKHLTDIGNFENLDFDAGEILLPDTETKNSAGDYVFKVYSSGAITTKVGTEFNIISSNAWDESSLNSLLSTTTAEFDDGLALSSVESNLDNSKYTNAYQISNSMEMEYNLVKWNLGHYMAKDANVNAKNQAEISYIQELCKDDDYGEASITPINKFININEITSDVDIKPALTSTDSGTGVLKLNSGYSVWVSNHDVTVKATDGANGAVRGIVVTKGDVFFDDSVTSFEGLIVSGGKVFITKNLSNMYSSPAVCQAIFRECQLLASDEAKTVLNLFKGYEITGGAEAPEVGDPASPTDPSQQAKTIENIDYSDVCRFNNWMKNVE